MNGLSSAEFAVDMGFSLKRLINLEKVALENLVTLGGLDPEAQQSLISWTGRALGKVRMSFREETFVTRALRNPTVKGCPVCLRDDAQATDGPLQAAMVMRGDWQLRNVNLCVQHKHPLVALWTESYPYDRFDFGTRLSEIGERIRGGDFDRPFQPPTSYDLWLDDRLATGSDTTWLKEQSLFAATTFCELLGVELLRSRGVFEKGKLGNIENARAVGFEVARRGREAIREALDELAVSVQGASAEPNKAFGSLFVQLARAYQDEADFSPFRDILRDCIFAKWPVAAGEIVLGEPLIKRRLHSVSTASKETKVGPALLAQFLVNAGAFEADDARPDARKTFDALKFAPLLEEVPKLIGPIEMRSLISATLNQFKSLVEDGVLVPAIDNPKIQSPWRREDGIALIEDLSAKAIPIGSVDEHWESIQQAKVRTGVRVGTIIEAIKAQQVQVGTRTGQLGYTALRVAKNEVDALIEAEPQIKRTDDLTVSAFGRQIGMREKGRFLAFIADGHTSSTFKQNPITGVWHQYMTQYDISVFHRRFMTSATMEAEFGKHRRTLLTKVLTAGVTPFAPNGEDYGLVFLRTDVEGALK